MKPTAEELKNGWTAEQLKAYHAQRDKACNLVGGNVVTQFVPPKKQPTSEPAGYWNTRHRPYTPHKWKR